MADNIATLADPTDFGNKPHEGPLRRGGSPVTPERDSDLPSTLSPQAKRQTAALSLCRDLWAGTETIRSRGETYLPRAPGEKPTHYRNRLARSAFFNAFRRTVEGLAGLVFRRDPVLGEDVPEPIVGHWENIDNAGTHADVFIRDLFEDALTAGHALIFVEFPATGGAQDARAEMVGAIRPYWLPIMKEDVMSWRTTVVNGRLGLTQLVLRERHFVPDGEFGEVEQTRYRVLHNDNGVVGWRLLEVTKANTVVLHGEGIYANQTEIPVAEIVTSGRRSLFDSDPPLLDLAHLNIAHYQMWSDYNWSIHKTCVPVLFGAGIPETVDPQTGKKAEVAVGANSGVFTSEPQAKLEYVSHSGQALGSVKAALDDLKSDMGALGLAMLAPQKRTAETAEAKRLDKATSDSALAVSARGLQDAVERALGFHAAYMRLDTGGSIEVNRDFEGLLMDAPVMQAFATLYNAGFPARPILDALQKGGRIAEDADLDALELEMLAGTAAREAETDADMV